MAQRKDDLNEKGMSILRQLSMLVLSIHVLAAMLAERVFSLPPETAELLRRIDNFVCLIFIGDFMINLVKAESKRAYLKWG